MQSNQQKRMLKTKDAEKELQEATDALSEGATVVRNPVAEAIQSKHLDVKSDEFEKIEDEWVSSEQEGTLARDREQNLALLERYANKGPKKQRVDETERKTGKEFHQSYDSMRKEKEKKGRKEVPLETETDETPETPKKKEKSKKK